MKKLIKLLFSLSLMISICACSSTTKDDSNNTTSSTADWRDKLEGQTSHLTFYYNNEKRGIIIQVVSDTQLNFYFDEKEEELYDSIILPFGTMDTSTVLDTLLHSDFDDNGYEDIEISLTDKNNRSISAIYKCDDGKYILRSFYSKEGVPPTDLVETWYVKADKRDKAIVIDEYGSWKYTDYTDTIYNHGYSYTDSQGTTLYDFDGNNCGSVSLNGDCLTLYINGEYWYCYDSENSF